MRNIFRRKQKKITQYKKKKSKFPEDIRFIYLPAIIFLLCFCTVLYSVSEIMEFEKPLGLSIIYFVVGLQAIILVVEALRKLAKKQKELKEENMAMSQRIKKLEDTP